MMGKREDGEKRGKGEERINARSTWRENYAFSSTGWTLDAYFYKNDLSVSLRRRIGRTYRPTDRPSC